VAEQYHDNVMFESDYPHPTSLTPAPSFEIVHGPRETIVEHLGGLPEDVLRKILHDNAAKLYHLEPLDP
jgi:predicted TIM-barrel fold metal-dependent hydrolase